MANNQSEYIAKLLSKYKFVINISQNLDLICIICKNILKHPYQSSCGCRYCLECIQNYLGNEEKFCPRQIDQCSKQLLHFERDLKIDNVANRKISEIKVKCPESLCKYTDELRNIGSHIEIHRIKCPYFDMGCGKTIDTINGHLKNDNYDHAVMLINFIHNMRNEMTSMKDNYDVIIADLQNEVSELKSVKDRHVQMISALETNCSISKFETKNMVNQIANLKNDMKLLKENCKKKEDKITGLKKRIQEIRLEDVEADFKLHGMREEQVQLHNQMSALYRKQGEILVKLKKQQANDTEIEVPKNDLSAGREMDCFESTSMVKDVREPCYSPFRWVVDNFTQLHHNAQQADSKPVMSSPFYSYRNGYKMRLALYPDGIGEGKNNHISVFYHILRGEYDDRLQWPMKHRVVISLIDQKTDRAHSSASFKYNSASNENQSALNRPTTDMNIGCGKFKFFKLNIAFNNARIFCRNRIVFECSIDD